jgi:hypothetical protein
VSARDVAPERQTEVQGQRDRDGGAARQIEIGAERQR